MLNVMLTNTLLECRACVWIVHQHKTVGTGIKLLGVVSLSNDAWDESTPTKFKLHLLSWYGHSVCSVFLSLALIIRLH